MNGNVGNNLLDQQATTTRISPTVYISERGQETQLRHEFRLKRHEKLTGPAF